MKKSFLIGTIIGLIGLTGCNAENNQTKKSLQKVQGKNNMNRVKTASGLEYEILQEGTGAACQKNHQVKVHYTGWLNTNGQVGTKFDSSIDRGEPFEFVLGAGYVIKGWDEGVASMKVGEKRRLFVPSTLGYGSRGAGNVIKPHADLIFDVELLKIS